MELFEASQRHRRRGDLRERILARHCARPAAPEEALAIHRSLLGGSAGDVPGLDALSQALHPRPRRPTTCRPSPLARGGAGLPGPSLPPPAYKDSDRFRARSTPAWPRPWNTSANSPRPTNTSPGRTACSARQATGSPPPGRRVRSRPSGKPVPPRAEPSAVLLAPRRAAADRLAMVGPVHDVSRPSSPPSLPPIADRPSPPRGVRARAPGTRRLKPSTSVPSRRLQPGSPCGLLRPLASPTTRPHRAPRDGSEVLLEVVGVRTRYELVRRSRIPQ